MPLLGTHISISGGVSKAFARAEELSVNAMQIFTKNASRWQAKPLANVEVDAFLASWKASSVDAIIAHDSYLINLAAPEGETRTRSIAAFLDELQRCAALGITHLVMHPGAHLGIGEEIGLQRIAEAFHSIFSEAPSEVTVLLENTAGQGSYLGYRFEHLAEIMARVPTGRFGICFDTCHAFAAGYDLTSAEGYQRVMDEFHRLIGTDLLAAFHLNDSKNEHDSRVDRHAHIGEGTIPVEVFQALMQDHRFEKVPKVLETDPGEQNVHHHRELALLRELAKGTS